MENVEKITYKSFMETHQAGTIMIQDKNIPFTVFAVLFTQPEDEIFSYNPQNKFELEEAAEKISKKALEFVEIEWEENNRLLLLSSHSDVIEGSKFVIAARLEL